MAIPPILETSRLRLVPFDQSFISDRYVGWLNDPATVRFSEQRHATHSLASCHDFLKRFQGASPHFFWAMLTRDDGQHIGNVTGTVIPHYRVGEPSILVGERAAHGKGLGTEAYGAVSEFLLGPAGMRKLESGAMATNSAMLAVFRHCGFHEEGRKKRHFVVDGVEVDMVLTARFAAD